MSARAIPPSKEAIIGRLEAALVARIGPARFGLWFPRNTAFVPTGDELVVGVATGQFQEWLEHTFGEAIRAAAAEASENPLPVRFVVDPGLLGEPAAPEPAPASALAAPPDRPVQPNLFGESHPLPPHPRAKRKPLDGDSAGTRSSRRFRRLDDFVVGACNRVAHASALAAVEEPGLGANPLVLHGPVGTGKTHLLEGVYAGLRRAMPADRPCFVTAEEFTSRFVQAARYGRQSGFRRQFRDCSALLLDDLHGLATKRATQEEFLYTFDSLIADGRQVVVTLDCHPRLAEELMPELVDRLLGGAVWGLLPPDDETRLGILRQKSAGEPPFPDEVLRYLARNLRGNVRELEGAVHGVRHFARVTGSPVTPQLAREALGELLRHSVRSITLADVEGAVCSVLRLAAGTLQSKARSWAVTHPRAIAIFLARKHTAATYGEIARHFGVRTHSTAVAAEKKVRGWVKENRSLTIGDRAWRVEDLIAHVERILQR